ncbi:MAG: Trm112 family protein [Deltaproteobacteria bacterium]
MPLDEKLLKIIVCPKCKGKIRLGADGSWLICDSCGIKFPVKDGIPILMAEESEEI